MSHRLTTHVTAMRRQIRRVLWTSGVGTGLLLIASVVLLTVPPADGWSILLGVVFLGYLIRKARQFFWGRQTLRQLRLEEQFICHGPTPERVVTCLRRRNHLWTSSLVLRGLRSLFNHPPRHALFYQEKQERFRQTYSRAFGSLTPSRLADLLWFTALLFLWIWAVPETLFQTPSLALLLSSAVLTVTLTAEVIQAVLYAELRWGFAHLASMLSDWMLIHHFEESLLHRPPKPYRHTLIYNAGLASLRHVA